MMFLLCVYEGETSNPAWGTDFPDGLMMMDRRHWLDGLADALVTRSGKVLMVLISISKGTTLPK
jgi:hypothetical protein